MQNGIMLLRLHYRNLHSFINLLLFKLFILLSDAKSQQFRKSFLC